MGNIKKFHLVAQRQQGLNIKIEWSKIPHMTVGINETDLQTIDQFTSRFDSEAELKKFIKQYALEIGLSVKPKKISENELCVAITNFLFSKFDENDYPFEFKKTLYSLSDSIGSDLAVIKALQNVAKTSATKDTKQEAYQAIVVKEIFESIQSPSFPTHLKTLMFNYAKGLMDNNELVQQLNDEVEKIEINFMFEVHPFKIVFYVGSSQKVLYDGVAYRSDVQFLDREYITQYLMAKTVENDFDLLNRIIKLYGKNEDQKEFIDAIKNYIFYQKAKLATNYSIPRDAIMRFVEREIEEINSATMKVKKSRDGSPVLNYYNLRKLGMFLSKYEIEKQLIYAASRKANPGNPDLLMEEPKKTEKPLDKPFQLNMFDKNSGK